MIHASKQREIAEEQEREALRLAELNRSTPVYPSAPVSQAMAYPSAGPAGAPPGFGGPLGAARGGPPPPMMDGFAPPPQGAPPPPMMARMSAPMPPAPAPARPPAPPPAPAPTPVTAAPAPPAPAVARGFAAEGGATAGGDVVDYTLLPALLDKRFEELDEDGALRATILHPGDRWTRTAQKGLLSAPEESRLSAKQQKEEKNRAFDLLDALTKSGALPIDDATLHVVLAATHGFDRTLLETVIQDNVNPIEKVERSLMIVGTTIHGRPASELLADDQRERFLASSPRLGLAPAAPAADDPAEG